MSGRALGPNQCPPQHLGAAAPPVHRRSRSAPGAVCVAECAVRLPGTGVPREKHGRALQVSQPELRAREEPARQRAQAAVSVPVVAAAGEGQGVFEAASRAPCGVSEIKGPAACLHEPAVFELHRVLRQEGAPFCRVSRRIQNAHVQAARAVFEGAARKEGAHHAGANDCLHELAFPVAPKILAELRGAKSLLRKINE